MTTILSLPDGFAPPADRRISQQPTGSPKRFWSSRLENVVAIIVISKSAFEVREGVPKEIEQQICDNIKWIRWSFFTVSWLLFVCLLPPSLILVQRGWQARDGGGLPGEDPLLRSERSHCSGSQVSTSWPNILSVAPQCQGSTQQ